MKLYYTPGACSLASHIALYEAGLKFEIAKVDLRTKQLSDGTDFRQLSQLGYVPVLELKNGELLTEGPAILQFIADQAPGANLAPANGSFARYRLQSALNFIATEVHKNFSPLFDPTAEAPAKAAASSRLNNRLAYLDQQLAAQNYLVGDNFSVADAYLFTVLGFARMVKFDLSPFAHLQAYKQRIAARPSVIAAMTAEGLIR